MVVSSHQSEKLSQLQTMLEAGRAGPLPVGDCLELLAVTSLCEGCICCSPSVIVGHRQVCDWL